MQRTLDNPSPPRNRPQWRPVESDYEESRQPGRPAGGVGCGLRVAALAGREGRLGATSQVGGRSTARASGTISSMVVEVTPTSSFEPPTVPDRRHQLAERVDGDVGQDHEWQDHSWQWNWHAWSS